MHSMSMFAILLVFSSNMPGPIFKCYSSSASWLRERAKLAHGFASFGLLVVKDNGSLPRPMTIFSPFSDFFDFPTF